MRLLSLLCLLPAIQGQITINILASSEPNTILIDRTGSSNNIITKQDENAFNITEQLLKNAVSKLTGRVPTDVYLKGPTPWNDLYRTYDWEPVNTVIIPVQAKILNVGTENAVIKKKTAVNQDNYEKKETIQLDGKVENKMTTSWNTIDVFAANITYNFDIFGRVNAGLTFNSSWGENEQVSHVADAGTSSSTEVVLPPHGNITAVLSSSKVTAVIEIEYAAILDGHVVTNNEVRLDGHHFWRYDIGSVMSAVNFTDIIKATEVITLEYYTDYVFSVID